MTKRNICQQLVKQSYSLIAAKAAKLEYATKAVENVTRDLTEWQLEKEIWENVEGLPEQQPEEQPEQGE
jgi:flagellar biosynthesis chaperone FliJ